MKVAFARLVILLIVFCLALTGVTIWRKWQDDRGLPGFLRSKQEKMLESGKGPFTPEDYTLEEEPALNLEEVSLLARLNAEYTHLINEIVPSVVSIDTWGERQERRRYQGQTYERTWEASGIGSGVIVSKEGHIVTNEHVIDGTLSIQVTLHDGRSYSARLIGEDPTLDIAVLRIEGEGPFEPLRFGDSDRVNTGEMIFAVGNPFGLGETVTQGIISAKERSISARQRGLFQTDAAINPGNSGGPLVNYRGEIVGINVAIYSSDSEHHSFSGVGFSIPANDVRRSFEQILKRGRPIQGFLGLLGRDLSSRDRYELSYRRELGRGVIVDSVSPGGPAEKAGLLSDDIVQRFNGQEIRSRAQLINLTQRAKVGEEITLLVWRNKEVIELKSEIIDYDDWKRLEQTIQKNRPLADNQTVFQRLGLQLRNLTVLEKMQGAEGVLVANIDSKTVAKKVGINPGDLIISINGRRITKANDLLGRLAASASVQETKLVLKRGKKTIDILVPRLVQR